MTPKSIAGIIALVLLMAQASEPFGVSDYPEAISYGCWAMAHGHSPYSVVCSSGNPISPGAGYLFLFLVSGLFLVPWMVPVIGLGMVVAMVRGHDRFHVIVAALLLVTLRSTIQGMDYLFARGALCWLLLLA